MRLILVDATRARGRRSAEGHPASIGIPLDIGRLSARHRQRELISRAGRSPRKGVERPAGKWWDFPAPTPTRRRRRVWLRSPRKSRAERPVRLIQYDEDVAVVARPCQSGG